jgi:hypothetical protein
MPAAITRYGMASYINMLRAIAEGIARIIRSRQSGNASWLKEGIQAIGDGVCFRTNRYTPQNTTTSFGNPNARTPLPSGKPNAQATVAYFIV